MKILAERVGIPLTFSQKKAVKGSPEDKQTLYQAMLWAVERYAAYLQEAPEAKLARDYLDDRGFSIEAVREFRLGFAPLKWSWLSDQAQQTEFSLEVLTACDLIGQSDRGSGYFERFRGRLIFPILDTMNRPIAIGGRLVPGVFPADKEPAGKYVNSRETRLFSKSETLYGLNMVKNTVAKSRALTVVEGYTDVMAAWQAGLRDVVACLGTALNQKHIRLIKRFADRITLVLDGDDAGRKRANEVLDLFVANDVDLRILTLPEGKDPHEFLQLEGTDAFTQLVERASDAIAHKIRIETQGVDLVRDTHRSNAALENVLSTLARIPTSIFAGSADKVLRQDQLLTRLSRQFGVEREQLKRRLVELRSKTGGVYREDQPQNDQRVATDFNSLQRREIEVLQLLLHGPEHLDTIIENISPGQFVEGLLKRLYEYIDQCFQNGEDTSFEQLMLSVEDAELKNVLVYLDGLWHERQLICHEQSTAGPEDPAEEIIAVFRKLELESGNRRAISNLQQNLDEEEELSTLEDLLRQTRQQHGL